MSIEEASAEVQYSLRVGISITIFPNLERFLKEILIENDVSLSALFLLNPQNLHELRTQRKPLLNDSTRRVGQQVLA